MFAGPQSALLIGIGVLIGLAVAALIAFGLRSATRTRAERPRPLSTTTEALLESMPIPAVILGESMRPIFMNSAYRQQPDAARRVLQAEWLQRTVMEALVEGRAASRPSDIDNQESVHILPLRSDRVAVLVWDEGDRYTADAVRQDFIANASHELNTPVSAILLLAEAIQKSAAKDKKTARFADALHGEAERLAALTRDIGRLAQAQRRGAGIETMPVEVGSVAHEVLVQHRALADSEQVALHFTDTSDGWMAAAEPQALAVALGNLVENAVQHSPDSGTVAVRVYVDEGEGRLRVSVTDSGPGVRQEDRERIFQRFYRVDTARERKTGGTGLGLSIARNIARGFGGDVTVESRPGQGSKFTLSVPLAPERDQRQRHSFTPADAARDGSNRDPSGAAFADGVSPSARPEDGVRTSGAPSVHGSPARGDDGQ